MHMFQNIRSAFFAMALAAVTSLVLGGGTAQASTGSNGNGGTAINNCVNIGNNSCVAAPTNGGTVINKCFNFYGFHFCSA
jgi:hypothetical protein